MGLAAGWKDLLHATLRQESVGERQGDTQHEGEWFGLARFGLVGLAARWKDLLHATLREESDRERQGDTVKAGNSSPFLHFSIFFSKILLGNPKFFPVGN